MTMKDASNKELQKWLKEEKDMLAAFEGWKKRGKPEGEWFSRNCGTGAKNTIQAIKKILKMRETK